MFSNFIHTRWWQTDCCYSCTGRENRSGTLRKSIKIDEQNFHLKWQSSESMSSLLILSLRLRPPHGGNSVQLLVFMTWFFSTQSSWLQVKVRTQINLKSAALSSCSALSSPPQSGTSPTFLLTLRWLTCLPHLNLQAKGNNPQFASREPRPQTFILLLPLTYSLVPETQIHRFKQVVSGWLEKQQNQSKIFRLEPQ